MYELTAAETNTPAQMETDQHAIIKVYDACCDFMQ